MGILGNIKHTSVLLLLVLSPMTAFAKSSNRSIISYFTDSIVFQTLYAGGYYTLGIILVLSIFSLYSEKFRQVFLSVVLAILGVLLLTFIYEALEDFEFIPPIYS
ncbi:MAG: hypothetical protein NWP47_02820 [Rickettsiaceae bacterium]|nr:hypothetical protein [Rickettsiaceae bacterium]